MVPGKEGGQRTFPGQLGSGREQGSCRAPTVPTLSLLRTHPRAPCFVLDNIMASVPYLAIHPAESCPASPGQIDLRFRNPHPRKQAATSQEILGSVRTKPQNEQSAKQKLG